MNRTRLAAAIALAACKKDPLPAPVPVPPVPAPADAAPTACLPDENDLHAIAGPPLLACADKAHRCVSLDLATGKVSEAGFVAAAPAAALPHATVDGTQVCFEGACKPLGKRLRHAARGKDATGTTDLAAVIVVTDDLPTVWSVGHDRPILSDDTRSPMGLSGAVAVGSAVYTEWAPPEAVVYTSAGKPVTGEMPGESYAPTPLAGSRWYVLTKMHYLELFDGTSHHEVNFAPDGPFYVHAAAAALPDGKLAIVTSDTAYVIDVASAAITKTWPLCANRSD